MGQVEIKNDLPYQVAVLNLADSEGVPVAAAVVKATYSIEPHGLVLSEIQQPILYAGEPYSEAGKSSYRYEPECAYFKPATDVILIAAATSPAMTGHVEVEFTVGRLRKRARVFGDRYWYRSFIGTEITGPAPFRELPLVYERSYGGWDRSHPDPERHSVDLRNPVGRGFQAAFAKDEDLLPMPNIEDPDDLVSSMKSRPTPAGFGFVNPDWYPRARLAGTYDDAWRSDRMPALPLDFDARFFNAASLGLVSDGYLIGNEAVCVTNCCGREFRIFNLPGVPPPCCRFRLYGLPLLKLQGRLDTIVVNAVEDFVTLTWRCHARLPGGPEQLRRVRVSPN